jgi:hypothetical protein
VVRFASRPLYPWGKSLLYSLDRRLGGLHGRSGRGVEGNNPCPFRGLNHDFPASSLVFVLTDLPRLRIRGPLTVFEPQLNIRFLGNCKTIRSFPTKILCAFLILLDLIILITFYEEGRVMKLRMHFSSSCFYALYLMSKYSGE